ncbi:MAG: N-acetylmuramoyl-L-alanine amidase [Rhodoferax sp.]
MKKLLLLCLVALLTGCASGPRIDSSFAAVSQDSRVRYLILHFTFLDSPTSLRVLTQQQVSSHYLVDDGAGFKIYRLVDEDRRAYHAGQSSWKGNTGLNASSIGIEIVNPGWRETGEGRQWIAFPQGQIDRLIPLVRDIVKRHDIAPDRVLAHSDVAPQRKQDPGPMFPWKQLADAGLVLWPDEKAVARRQREFELQLPNLSWFQKKLAEHGFAIAQTGELDDATRNVLVVFQMKYRPGKFDGIPDAQTAAILDVLTASHSK